MLFLTTLLIIENETSDFFACKQSFLKTHCLIHKNLKIPVAFDDGNFHFLCCLFDFDYVINSNRIFFYD